MEGQDQGLSEKVLTVQNAQRKRKLEITSLSQAVGLVSLQLCYSRLLFLRVLSF